MTMFYRRMLGVVVVVGIGLVVPMVEAADQRVVLMLGGESCASHPMAVGTALKKVEGVKSVDLTNMPGHAIVRAESGSITPEQLISAVGRVKGTNWHCTPEVMK
jgi:copper chaperone CopZ